MKIRFNHETKVWDEIQKGDEPTIYDITIDGFLYEVLMAIKKDLKNELDHLMIVGGDVGAGKSNGARIMARFVSDERFHPKTHMIRDVDDIKRVISNAKKGESIIFDEGSLIFSSTDVMTKKTKFASVILDICRQKNLFICILAPDIHRLASKVAIDRAKTFVRVYMHSKSQRKGYFAFYGTHLKDKLYYFAKKTGTIKGCKAKWRGKFCLDRTFSEEYKQVKDETLNLALDSWESKKEQEKKKISEKDISIKIQLDFLRNNPDKTVVEMAKMWDVAPRTIKRWRAKIKLQDKNENVTSTNQNTTIPKEIEVSGVAQGQ